MKNGVTIYREKAGLTKADLARRLGVHRTQINRLERPDRKVSSMWAERIAPILNCDPMDIMWPHRAALDTQKFSNVFAVAGAEIEPESAVMSLGHEFLRQMLPGSPSKGLRLVIAEQHQAGMLIGKGDAVIVDVDQNRPTKPAVYAVEIAGTVQLRQLSPTTAGMIVIQGGDNSLIPTETVKPADIKVIGRAVLKIAAI